MVELFKFPMQRFRMWFTFIVPLLVILLGIGFLVIFMVEWLRPERDNTSLLSLLFGLFAPTIVASLTLFTVRETHVLVNSRMSELLEQTRLVERALGLAEGLQQQRLREEVTKIEEEKK